MINKQQRIQELITELNKASEIYYSGQSELISNYEWDAKFDELQNLERETGIILDNSPTHNISREKHINNKIKHEFPALSLPKSKEVKDLIRYADSKPINLSWKLDGLTLVVIYNNGKLSKVITRGDGIYGSDITHLAPAIANIPETINYKKHIVIRGEAVISYSDFENLNAKYDNAYENPRNLAAGSCNPLTDLETIKDRCLTFIPFTLVYFEDNDIKSWNARMEFLRSLKFKTVDSELISDPENLESYINKWSDKVETFDYPVDGLVITYDDVIYASQGNLTGHHDTRGGYAFKWPDEVAETVLENIEWSVSMNSINPVAIFKPVRLEGTTVTRASLCNISECERLNIGGPGTKLNIIKANKIIPKVISAEKHDNFNIPDTCPVCKFRTAISTSETGIKTLICINENCSAKNLSKLTRFVSKYAFDINGLSEKKLEDLVNKNLISNIYDIIDIINNKEKLILSLENAENWGEKSINNLIKSIEKARNITTDKFLYSLCIPSCGRHASKDIASKYSVNEFLDLDYYHLCEIVGDAKAENILDYNANPENRKLFNKLKNICNITDINQNGPTQNTLKDKTFVITGSLNNFKSRDELKELIEYHGGKVSGSVSAKTSYLINNDNTSSSSKNKKAHELNIKIITEEDFMILLESLKKG